MSEGTEFVAVKFSNLTLIVLKNHKKGATEDSARSTAYGMGCPWRGPGDEEHPTGGLRDKEISLGGFGDKKYPQGALEDNVHRALTQGKVHH